MDRKKFEDSKKINIKFLKNKQDSGSKNITVQKNNLNTNSTTPTQNYKRSFASQVLNRPENYLENSTNNSAMQNNLHSTEKSSNIAKNTNLNSSSDNTLFYDLKSNMAKNLTTESNQINLNDNSKVIVDHYKNVNENLAKEKSEEQKLLEQNNEPILSKLNNSLKNFQILKFFSNKNNKIASVVVLAAIVLVILLNLNKNPTSSTNNSSQNFNAVDYVSSKNYIHNLEENLKNILSSIQGAGKVSVMITLESGPELKIATNIDERSTTTTTGQNSSTVNVNVIKNPIIITQNGKSAPLVLMEIMPTIKGVIVVAQGANNTKVKLQLLQAVQALLEVPNNNIQIYSGI